MRRTMIEMMNPYTIFRMSTFSQVQLIIHYDPDAITRPSLFYLLLISLSVEYCC